MQELKDKIIKDGEVLNSSVLKVDAFLNHQIDPDFTYRMGEELARRFKDKGVTKILTVEASGIVVAAFAGLVMGVPVIFAKKKKAATQDLVYKSEVFSFTRQESVNITVSRKFITPDDVVLIIDDFLAHGEALKGLVSIVRQSQAKLIGAGIVIEKRFQKGGEKLREEGIDIQSLASVVRMEPGHIEFYE